MRKNEKDALKEILAICRENEVDLVKLLETAVAEDSMEDSMEREDDKSNLEKEITEILKEIGIPASIRGFRYIRYAIMYSIDNKDALNGITKVLYPQVAEKFGTTPIRVERAIRHAIEVAWDRGSTKVLHKYFGNTISLGKPTNSEFIAMIADNIKVG